MEGQTYDREETGKMYRFLRHDGFSTQVHCQDMQSGGVIDRRTVGTEGELVEWASEFNGRGNCFVGRNPRFGSSVAARTFALDIDPIRPKGTAATPTQRAKARLVAQSLLSRLPGGWLLDTGNGYQLVYSWPEAGLDAKSTEEFAEKSKAFTDSLRAHVGPATGCDLDNVADLPRLIKLAGTLSTKGDRSEWRVARFVGPMPSDAQGLAAFRRIMATPLQRRTVAAPVDRPLSREILVAAEALNRLDPRRKDDYDDWLRVGMCLRVLGEAGLQLWDDWSKGTPKYVPGVCADKWNSFEPGVAGDGITLGSLIAWARDDYAGAAGVARSSQVGGSFGQGPIGGTASFSAANLLGYDKNIAWIAAGLIPAQGGTILGGQGGIGKSWLALELALAVARGEPWLGDFPTAKGRVLYLDEESSPQLLKRRLARLCAGRPVPGPDELEFRIQGGVNFSDPMWVEQFAAGLRERPVSLIVVDCLREATPAEENSSSELAAMFANVKRIITECGCAVVFLDHESKQALVKDPDGTKQEANSSQLRGSNVKSTWADSIILVKGCAPQVTLFQTKSRFVEAATPFTVGIRDVESATVVRREK